MVKWVKDFLPDHLIFTQGWVRNYRVDAQARRSDSRQPGEKDDPFENERETGR